jgi:predicted transcriptional regulator
MALRSEEEFAASCEADRSSMLGGTVVELIEAMETLLPAIDVQALKENEEIAANSVDGIEEGLRNNADGMVDDTMSLLKVSSV